jgi:hypothetical protein
VARDEVLAEAAWLEGCCGRGELGAPGRVVGGAVCRGVSICVVRGGGLDLHPWMALSMPP